MTKTLLTETLDQAWACMAAGAGPGRSRFSMVQVASIGQDGAPRARTVVIRAVDAEARTLAFHTDRRSPKVAELRTDPRVTIIGYDMEAGQQVRIQGDARLHIGDSEAMAAWGGVRGDARVNYRGSYAPGQVLDDPQAAVAAPSDDPKIGFDKFCRVVIKAQTIDWLNLAANGHRRAVHVWSGSRWDSAWVAP